MLGSRRSCLVSVVVGVVLLIIAIGMFIVSMGFLIHRAENIQAEYKIQIANSLDAGDRFEAVSDLFLESFATYYIPLLFIVVLNGGITVSILVYLVWEKILEGD